MFRNFSREHVFTSGNYSITFSAKEILIEATDNHGKIIRSFGRTWEEATTDEVQSYWNLYCHLVEESKKELANMQRLQRTSDLHRVLYRRAG